MATARRTSPPGRIPTTRADNFDRIGYKNAPFHPTTNMQFSRFMDAGTFRRELDALRAYRDEYVGEGLLEKLEASGLVVPRLRIRYPDPAVRRAWLLSHSESPRRLKHPTEPDGPRWEDVLAFDKALHRSQNWIVYGLGPNPLDDVDERFAQFVEHPSPETFVPHEDFCVDVSNDKEERLFTDNCDDRYSTWQLLLAAEQVDAGIYLRMNLDGEGDHSGRARNPEAEAVARKGRCCH